MQSGRQTVRRVIIFWPTCMSAILFWAYSYHLILGVLAKFLAYITPVRPLTKVLCVIVQKYKHAAYVSV